MKSIGILGGMGPESTAYTYMRMIRYCQEKFGAKFDSDFPPILIYSMPVPDVVEKGSDDSEVLGFLEYGVEKLKSAGAVFSFIPCNTMQGFIPQLRKKTIMLSLVEESVKEAKKKGVKRWGILATEVTVEKGFYQQAFSDAGLSILEPDTENQKKVTFAIREILEGNKNEEVREKLLDVVSRLREEGAEGIILACTDLPIVLSEDNVGLKMIDTADTIARAAVDNYKEFKSIV